MNNTEEKVLQHFGRVPHLEYVGGYTHTEKPVNVRCRECGNEFSVNFQCIRGGTARCDVCYRRRLEEQRIEKKKEKEIRREERKAKIERRRLMREQEAAERKAKKMIPHPCPVCGEETTRPKYCSKRCGERRQNRNREIARRDRMKSQMVDKDITLEALFNLERGRCYICGLLCSWDDFTTKNGAKITGNFYPSIEHIVPLSKGGWHSWQNVRLAHRRCNAKKGNRDKRLLIPVHKHERKQSINTYRDDSGSINKK